MMNARCEMDWTGCRFVEQVPGKVGGVPILVHSRMQADGVLENYEDGMTAEEISEDFGLELQAVQGVLMFAKMLRPEPTAA
jgi:uncharacterized protein (DUF433 family)